MKILLTLTLCICIITVIEVKPSEKKNRSGREQADTPAEYKLRVPVNLVLVSATVTDKHGNAVTDLVAKDFKVYEDGKIQPIQTFSLETYRRPGQIQEHNPSLENSRSTDSPSTGPNHPDSESRQISMLVDDVTASSIQDLNSATNSIKRYLLENYDREDEFCISLSSGNFHLPFTQNRSQLLNGLEELQTKVNLNRDYRSDCPMLSDSEAQRVSDKESDLLTLDQLVREAEMCSGPLPKSVLEQNVRTAANQQYSESRRSNLKLIAAIRQQIESLSHLDGKRMLVLFSGGFYDKDLLKELADIVDTALQKGILLHAIDIRGLYTTNFQASEAVSPGPTSEGGVLLNNRMSQRISEMRIRKEPLAMLAEDTGGIFSNESNDISAGLKKIMLSQSCYYLLSYASPAQDGTRDYHKIKLEVSRPGLKLKYRKGYYGGQKRDLGSGPQIKRHVLEAMQACVGRNEIPLRISYDVLKLDLSSYEVSVVSTVSLKGLPIETGESRMKNLIKLYVVIYDENNHYLDGMEKEMEMNLTNPNYQALLQQGLTSQSEFTVPSGRYTLRVAIRENIGSKAAFVEKTLQVP